MSTTRADFRRSASLDIAVLANYDNEIFAIDLKSRALLRFEVRETEFDHLTFNPFAHWRIALAEDSAPTDLSRPELVEVSEIIPVGQLHKRKQIDQLCSASSGPQYLPLLGFNGPSISYGLTTGRSPSISILKLTKRQAIRKNSYGEITISFPWGPVITSVPIGNEIEKELFAKANHSLNTDKDIERVIGFRPKYVVIGLAKPTAGYCKKIAVGLLPEKISRSTAKILRSKQLESQPISPSSSSNTPVTDDLG